MYSLWPNSQEIATIAHMPNIIKIKVTPRGSRTEILGELPDGTMRIKLAAPPVDGAANDELIKFLSEEWNIPRSKIQIKSGYTSRLKTIIIED